MATRKTGSNAVTDPKTILEMVQYARQALGDRGDGTALEQLVAGLAAELRLPEAAIAEELARDRERVDERRRRIGPELLEAAQAANCTAEYKHPFVTVGCVTFKEVKPGEWKMSILDSIQVGTVNTGSGKILVEQAVARIVEIEESLRRTEAFAKDLLTASDALLAGASRPVPLNVVMVLCSQGTWLSKALASSHRLAGERGLSRAQFGFLIANVLQLSADGTSSKIRLRIRLHGATQSDTKQPNRYIAVPDSVDPRRESKSRMITSATIEKG